MQTTTDLRRDILPVTICDVCYDSSEKPPLSKADTPNPFQVQAGWSEGIRNISARVQCRQIALTRTAHYAFDDADSHTYTESHGLEAYLKCIRRMNHSPLPSKMHYYRGPSRILWFFIGAATTSWLFERRLKSKDDQSRIFSHCMRLQHQTPPPNSSFVPDGTPFTLSVPNS